MKEQVTNMSQVFQHLKKKKTQKAARDRELALSDRLIAKFDKVRAEIYQENKILNTKRAEQTRKAKEPQYKHRRYAAYGDPCEYYRVRLSAKGTCSGFYHPDFLHGL